MIRHPNNYTGEKPEKSSGDMLLQKCLPFAWCSPEQRCKKVNFRRSLLKVYYPFSLFFYWLEAFLLLQFEYFCQNIQKKRASVREKGRLTVSKPSKTKSGIVVNPPRFHSCRDTFPSES